MRLFRLDREVPLGGIRQGCEFSAGIVAHEGMVCLRYQDCEQHVHAEGQFIGRNVRFGSKPRSPALDVQADPIRSNGLHPVSIRRERCR